MSSDILNQLSSPSATAALLVAGLGAVFAFAQLGARTEGAGPGEGLGDGRHGSGVIAESESKGAKDKTRRRRKGKEAGAGGQGEEKTQTGAGAGTGTGTGTGAGAVVVPFPKVVPGDFEVNPATGTDTDAAVGVLAGASPTTDEGNAAKRRKKKKQNRCKAKREGAKDEGNEATEGAAPDDAREPRAGDTTDASAPASSSLGLGNDNLRASASLAPPSRWSNSRGLRPSPSLDTDSSWTHIQPRREKNAKKPDPTDVTSSDAASTASESPVTDMRAERGQADQRTLAEKLVPKPRKTGVDDMLEQPDVATLARVMRVKPRADETPVPGFSWEDYGDVVDDGGHFHDADEEDEGEWGVVMGRTRQRHSRTVSTSTPVPAQPVAPSPTTMTKKQKQNAKKRALVKATRDETEVARLEGLARHKRELERLRIIEQSRQGGGKRPSGGMQATVDDRGKLVWE